MYLNLTYYVIICLFPSCLTLNKVGFATARKLLLSPAIMSILKLQHIVGAQQIYSVKINKWHFQQ